MKEPWLIDPEELLDFIRYLELEDDGQFIQDRLERGVFDWSTTNSLAVYAHFYRANKTTVPLAREFLEKFKALLPSGQFETLGILDEIKAAYRSYSLDEVERLLNAPINWNEAGATPLAALLSWTVAFPHPAVVPKLLQQFKAQLPPKKFQEVVDMAFNFHSEAVYYDSDAVEPRHEVFAWLLVYGASPVKTPEPIQYLQNHLQMIIWHANRIKRQMKLDDEMLKQVDLLTACYYGDLEEVEKLLDRDPRCFSRANFAPLIISMRQGSDKTTAALLEHLRSNSRPDALAEGVDIARAYLRRGADKQKAWLLIYGVKSQDLYIEGHEKEMANVLREICQNNPLDRALEARANLFITRFTLIESVRSGDLGQAETILAEGVNTEEDSDLYWNLLKMATQQKNTDVAKALVKYLGINYSKSPGGATPIHLAAKENHVELLAWLIKEGVSPQPEVLLVAAAEGHIETAQLLVKHWRENLAPDDFVRTLNNAGIYEKDDEDDELENSECVPACHTAIYEAAIHEHLELVELLFEAGASIWCHSPRDPALSLITEIPGSGSFIQRLVESSEMMRAAVQEKINTASDLGLDAVYYGNTAAAKLFLEMRTKHEPIDYPALENAVCNNNVKMVELLLRLGVKYNRETAGFSLYEAFKCALRKGESAVVKMLLYHLKTQLTADEFAKFIAYNFRFIADKYPKNEIPSDVLEKLVYLRLYGAEIKWYEVTDRGITPEYAFFHDHRKQISRGVKQVCEGFDGISLRQECKELQKGMDFQSRDANKLFDRCYVERDGTRIDDSDSEYFKRWRVEADAKALTGIAAISALISQNVGNALQIGARQNSDYLEVIFPGLLYCMICVYLAVKMCRAMVGQNDNQLPPAHFAAG